MILLSNPSVIRRLIDLWQQLELTSNLEFDLQDAVDWSRKWLLVT